MYTAAQKSEAVFPLKRYLLLAANNIIKLSVQLIVIYLCAHKLSLKDYALYQTVWLYVNVLSVIALFGLPNLILAYPTGNIVFWLRKNKLAVVVFFIGLNVLPLLYLLFIESNFSWQARGLLALLVIVQNVSVIAEARAIKLELEKRVVRANLLYAILFLAIHIFLLYYGYSLPLLLVILVILQIVKTLFLSRSIPAQVAGLQPLNLGKQWLYLGLGEVLGVIYKWLDKWLILYFISLTRFILPLLPWSLLLSLVFLQKGLIAF